jgi:hypothetical protein
VIAGFAQVGNLTAGDLSRIHASLWFGDYLEQRQFMANEKENQEDEKHPERRTNGHIIEGYLSTHRRSARGSLPAEQPGTAGGWWESIEAATGMKT